MSDRDETHSSTRAKNREGYGKWVADTAEMNKAIADAFSCGVGLVVNRNGQLTHMEVPEFWYNTEPGERLIWWQVVPFPPEPYDDGGGAALAAYQYGNCPFAKE